jgi:hypothetical protein
MAAAVRVVVRQSSAGDETCQFDAELSIKECISHICENVLLADSVRSVKFRLLRHSPACIAGAEVVKFDTMLDPSCWYEFFVLSISSLPPTATATPTPPSLPPSYSAPRPPPPAGSHNITNDCSVVNQEFQSFRNAGATNGGSTAGKKRALFTHDSLFPRAPVTAGFMKNLPLSYYNNDSSTTHQRSFPPTHAVHNNSSANNVPVNPSRRLQTSSSLSLYQQLSRPPPPATAAQLTMQLILVKDHRATNILGNLPNLLSALQHKNESMLEQYSLFEKFVFNDDQFETKSRIQSLIQLNCYEPYTQSIGAIEFSFCYLGSRCEKNMKQLKQSNFSSSNMPDVDRLKSLYPQNVYKGIVIVQVIILLLS